MTAKASTENTSIDDYATQWGVTPKAVEGWVEVVFQAFDVALPNRGPFNATAVLLLNEVAKHVSSQASQFFSETGERRRLKHTEFVNKARTSRTYQQKFQKFQSSENFSSSSESSGSSIQPVGSGAEDEIFSELAAITRESDDEVEQIKASMLVWEEQRVEELADFIEDSPNRQMRKLSHVLMERRKRRQEESLSRATNTAFKRGRA